MSRLEMAIEKATRLRQGVIGKGETTPAADVKQGFPMPSSTPAVALPKNPMLVTLHDPSSSAAEEYRKLKSALVEMKKAQGELKNSLLVTSAVPSEGKSLTALNLAISLAQDIDHSVLLIDADLRKPSLHRYLEVDQGVGLSDVLLGKAGIREATLPTALGKLSVMLAGSKPHNPAELLSSARMKDVLDELKFGFADRFVIFDSPPVLPFAETRSLARLVDGVVFVIKEKVPSQANVREALEALAGCQLFGTVYNGADTTLHDDSYSYYRYR